MCRTEAHFGYASVFSGLLEYGTVYYAMLQLADQADHVADFYHDWGQRDRLLLEVV